MTSLRRATLLVLSLLGTLAPLAVGPVFASTPVLYEVSLEGRDHHEMAVEVTFDELPPAPLEVRMSRTSPGRYALHEFAKNVYDVSVTDGRGRRLEFERPDLHQWTIGGHDGTVVFRYTLFADLSDGTYAAVDSSHAHLNIPATFVWARGLEDRPVEVRIDTPEGWQVFTQLEPSGDGAFSAPDLPYFIDSPIEVSSGELFSWTVGGLGSSEGGPEQTIELAIHHNGDEATAAALADLTKLVVDEQIALFGQTPRFDQGRYTFLVDALPWSDGDGMEHRNSTVVTTGGELEDRVDGLVGTISHEFIHAWNVERIRPASLEPFDLEAANLSHELWFAEGFTSYLGELMLVRSGIDDLELFVETLGYYVGYVLNAPGTTRRSPAEMSAQAPFVDAANANEPTNRTNTFVSYYTYGAALGLGLDLRLRSEFEGLSLDDFMRAAWERFGEPEVPYDNEDLRRLLGEVTGDASFADSFFSESVYGRQPPDFESLFETVGLRLRRKNTGEPWLGRLRLDYEEADQEKGTRAGARVRGALREGSPLRKAGVGRRDLLIRLGETELTSAEALEEALEEREPGETVELAFQKRGEERTVEVVLAEDERLEVVTFEAAGEEPNPEMLARRESWLAPRATPRVEVFRYCPETGQPHPLRFSYCPIHGDELTLVPKGETEAENDR